jgi:ubiquinone/menaquinone biosynthesis C-methylase UbiE
MEGFLNPSEVLKNLELRKDMIAADFGCGSGGWVIPLAKKLEEGKVFAIDILDEPLSALRAKIKLEKILNIEILKSDIEKTSRLLSNSCDLVLMTNLLFEVTDIKKVLEEGKRVLKMGGKILVVDWTPTLPPPSQPSAGPLIGPPSEKRVSPEKVKEVAKEFDLELEKEFEAGLYHWGLILVKPR